MKNLLILAVATLAMLSPPAASAETSAPSDRALSGVAATDRPFVGNWSVEEPSAACNPTSQISVDRFFARLGAGSHSNAIDVTVLVDGEIYGTETLSILEPATAGEVAVELLRFHPRERLRLLDLAAAGSRVELQSDRLSEDRIPLGIAVETRGDSPEDARLDSVTSATITRSTWSKGKTSLSEQDGLRRIFAELTFAECMSECQNVESDCISDWNCHWADTQCLGHCEQEREQCEEDCPCTGVDPILVRQYATQERIIVSGPHGSVCLKDAFSPGNVFYDVYTVFTRTRTYRVWEDCHGDQTTELVSTQNSGNHTCYVISDQFCSPALGPPPVCRMP